MKQVALISLYGRKPKPFVELVQGCLEIVMRSPVGRVFKPYHIDQIHGTIIGMEKLTGYAEPYNARIWEENGNKVVMDFSPLFPVLQQYFPFRIQLGGFSETFREFKSFGRLPHERSFQVQWKTKRFTLIGWAHMDGDFTSRRLLQELRDEIENRCRIRHKYRADNDLFMVLGEIAIPPSISENEINQLKVMSSSVEEEVRDHLADKKVDLMLDIDALAFAQYEEVTLPLLSTISHPLKKSGVDARFIEGLYE